MPVKKYLDLSGFFRFPIVPGTLGYVANATFDCSYETSISELASGKKVSPTMSRSISKDEPAKLKLNRPLKIALGADFYPFLDFMSISAKLGMGVRNPFPQVKGESYSFMEYYLAFTINLKNILKATISTEFTDEIYIQRLVGVLNLRAFELDTGISLQSPTLTKSFSLAGLGVYIGTAFGF